MSSFSDHIPSWIPGWRRFKDRAATASISIGGSGVLIAILLIFFYLLYEVLPLFGSAQLDSADAIAWQPGDMPLYLAIEEQGEVGFSLQAGGSGRFFSVVDGALIEAVDLTTSESIVTAIGVESSANRLVALGHADGSLRLLRHEYRLSYPDGERLITPRIDWQYEDVDLQLGSSEIAAVVVRDDDDALTAVAKFADGSLGITRFDKEEDFLSGDMTLEAQALRLPPGAIDPAHMFVGSAQRWLYLVSAGGAYQVYDLGKANRNGELALTDSGKLFERAG